MQQESISSVLIYICITHTHTHTRIHTHTHICICIIHNIYIHIYIDDIYIYIYHAALENAAGEHILRAQLVLYCAVGGDAQPALQCVAVCCSALQYVAVCGSVFVVCDS